jgi:hypothetical protein
MGGIMTDLIAREGSASYDEVRYVDFEPMAERIKVSVEGSTLRRPVNALLAIVSACNALILMANVGHLSGWKAAAGIVVAWGLVAFAVVVMARPARMFMGATALVSAVSVGIWLLVNTSTAVATSVVLAGTALGALALVLSLMLLGAPDLGTLWSPSTLVLGSIVPVGVAVITTVVLFVAPTASAGGSRTATSATGGAGGAKLPASAALAEATSKVVPGEKSPQFQSILQGNDTEQAELKPYVPLDTADQALLTKQLSSALQAAERFPTVASAKAAGMILAGGMAPGVGAHYQIIGASDLTSLDGSFNPSDPASWIYASTANNAPIVGVMYESLTAQPPSGFVGPNDHWHRHSNVCVQFTPGKIAVPFAADQSVTPQECADVHGDFMQKTVWMVHAWVVPGWESPQGVFSHDNLHVYCPGNTDLVDAIGFCTRQQ